MAVLLLPVVLLESAMSPMAVLLLPVVLFERARCLRWHCCHSPVVLLNSA